MENEKENQSGTDVIIPDDDAVDAAESVADVDPVEAGSVDAPVSFADHVEGSGEETPSPGNDIPVGTSAEDEAVPDVGSDPVVPEGKGKGILKKWWFWLIIIAVIGGIVTTVILVTGSSGHKGSSGGSANTVTVEDPYVKLVKTATNSNYGITYGDAFNKFFTNPKWSYFKADSGENVVEFTGGFSYSGSPATAKIQFVVDVSANTLEVYHLSINGEAQNRLMLAALVKKVFESY